MSIETIRAEIRGIEREIKVLQSTEVMSHDTLTALRLCFKRKWDLEKQIKQVA